MSEKLTEICDAGIIPVYAWYSRCWNMNYTVLTYLKLSATALDATGLEKVGSQLQKRGFKEVIQILAPYSNLDGGKRFKLDSESTPQFY